MVGLDTPKASRRVFRTYNLSSSGTSRSDVEPPSPTDSLNTLIERTLGSSRAADLNNDGGDDGDDGTNHLPPSSDHDFDNFEEILAKLSASPTGSSSSPVNQLMEENNDVFNDIQCGIMKYGNSNQLNPVEVEVRDVFTAMLIDFNRTSNKLLYKIVQLQVSRNILITIY